MRNCGVWGKRGSYNNWRVIIKFHRVNEIQFDCEMFNDTPSIPHNNNIFFPFPSAIIYHLLMLHINEQIKTKFLFTSLSFSSLYLYQIDII